MNKNNEIKSVTINYENGKTKEIESGMIVSIEDINGYNKVMNTNVFNLNAEEKRDLAINLMHILGKGLGIIEDTDYDDGLS